MGRGGLNIWHEYRLFCGSTQWLLVQPDTYATLQAALQKKLLNNKNALLLTAKFALSIVHTSNLFSKLLWAVWSILTNFNKEAEQFVQIFIWIFTWAILFLYSAYAERCSSKCITKQLSGLTGRIFTWRWKIWILFSTIYSKRAASTKMTQRSTPPNGIQPYLHAL